MSAGASERANPALARPSAGAEQDGKRPAGPTVASTTLQCTQILTPNSHYVHQDDPELVIREIRALIVKIRRAE
jgi:hypothetical protein